MSEAEGGRGENRREWLEVVEGGKISLVTQMNEGKK